MGRLIDADAFDKFLEQAEAEATRNRKYVFRSAINVIRGNLKNFPPAQPEIIMCRECIHNGSYDTDCPIDWNGKEYCSYAERWEE